MIFLVALSVLCLCVCLCVSVCLCLLKWPLMVKMTWNLGNLMGAPYPVHEQSTVGSNETGAKDTLLRSKVTV